MRQTPNILQSTAAAALYTWTALCMAGCTPDEAAQPAGIAVPLQISSVSVVSSQAETVTRATYDDRFFNGVHPAIEVTRLANSNYTNDDHEIYQLIDDHQYGYKRWEGKTGGLVLTQHPAEICTLFPEMGKDVKAIPIHPDKYDKSIDICYTPKQTVTANANIVSLEMKHALSRLVIALKQSGGAFNLEEITIGDVPLESQLDITTGTYQDPPTLTGVWGIPVSPAKPLSGNFLEYDWLMIPFATPVEGLKILLKMNGDYFSLTISQATLPELKAGYQYWVEITVNPVLVEVTEVKIVPWQNVTVVKQKWRPTIKGGQLGINVPANEINLGGTTCTEQDKQLLSKLIWAEGNIWVGNPNLDVKDSEWDPDVNFYDNTYPWLSWFDAGDNIDPCEQLAPEKYGTGWKTPTAAQLTALMHCTSLNRVRNPKYKEYRLTGMWAMKEGDGGIFLPARGYIYNKVSYNVNKSLYYWSRDEDNTNPNNGMAMTIIYNEVSDNYTCEVKPFPKVRMLPVRCVKEKTP